jgi:hypothetical protein
MAASCKNDMYSNLLALLSVFSYLYNYSLAFLIDSRLSEYPLSVGLSRLVKRVGLPVNKLPW